jgi:hypothetical protein
LLYTGKTTDEVVPASDRQATSSVTSTGSVAPIAQVGIMKTTKVKITIYGSLLVAKKEPILSITSRLKIPKIAIVSSINEKMKMRCR